jgi:hypothetical protein
MKEVVYKYTIIVKDLSNQKTYVISSLAELSYITGFASGYLSSKLRGRLVEDFNLANEYLITRKLKKITDVITPLPELPHPTRVFYRNKIDYDVLIHEEDGVLYYLDAFKKIKKSRRVLKAGTGGDRVIKLPVTEADYKRFDIEALYQEKFVEWRKRGIYRDDITLIKEFLDVIIWPDKSKSPTLERGRTKYNVTSLLDKKRR